MERGRLPQYFTKREAAGKCFYTEKTTTQTTTQSSLQTANSKISGGMAYKFNGNDTSKLNLFMQHSLLAMGYDSNSTDRICKCVIAHCNDEKMLSGIHNDLQNTFDNYSSVYENVKAILKRFVQSKSKVTKKESQVRSFFGQHLKKKIYVDYKEEIIQIILNANTKQQVNNGLLKLYSDGNVVSHIYKTVQPLISELSGQ